MGKICTYTVRLIVFFESFNHTLKQTALTCKKYNKDAI